MMAISSGVVGRKLELLLTATAVAVVVACCRDVDTTGAKTPVARRLVDGEEDAPAGGAVVGAAAVVEMARVVLPIEDESLSEIVVFETRFAFVFCFSYW